LEIVGFSNSFDELEKQQEILSEELRWELRIPWTS
jgi:hypothetical protein